ncbi:hypothetical protein JCM3774_002304 [Rhodotorula dairenensis]
MNQAPWAIQQQHVGATANTADSQLDSTTTASTSSTPWAATARGSISGPQPQTQPPVYDARMMDDGHAAYHMAVAASQPQLLQPQQPPASFEPQPPVYPPPPSGQSAALAAPQPLRGPTDLSLAELCQSRDFVTNRARVLGEQGGKRIEALLMPYLLSRLEADRLPTNEMTLRQFAPDMMPVTGTRPEDFLMIWSLWISWTKREIQAPSVPLVAPLVAYFLLDSVQVVEDRARLVQILDMYRHSVNEAVANMGGRNGRELVPDWDQTRWTEWSAMLQTGMKSLFDWRAIREACGLGAPTQQVQAAPFSSFSSAPATAMIAGPTFRPAVTAPPAQQYQDPPAQSQYEQSPQHSPPLAGPSTSPMAYHAQPPPCPPTTSSRTVSAFASYVATAPQQFAMARSTSQHAASNNATPSARPPPSTSVASSQRPPPTQPPQRQPSFSLPASSGGPHAPPVEQIAGLPLPASSAPSRSMPPTPLASPTKPIGAPASNNGGASGQGQQRRPSPPATSELLRGFRLSMDASQQPQTSGPAAPTQQRDRPQAGPQQAQPAPFAVGSNGSKAPPAPASAPAVQQSFDIHNSASSRHQQQRQRQQQHANGAAPGSSPTLSRRSMGSSDAAFIATGPQNTNAHRSSASVLDLAATNAQTRAAEAARLTAAESRTKLPPAQSSAIAGPSHVSSRRSLDQTASGMDVDGTSAAASASQAPPAAIPVLGKRKRVDVAATVEAWKRLGETAPTNSDLSTSAPQSRAAPGAQMRRKASLGQQTVPSSAPNVAASTTSAASAGAASQHRFATNQTLAIFQPPLQQAVSGSVPAARPQALQPKSHPQPQPLAQSSSSTGRLVSLTRQVPPPSTAQGSTSQSQLNVTTPAPAPPPKKRARGRPKKGVAQPAEAQQLPVVVDVPDEEFDQVVAEARGAIQAFQAARTAFVVGWHANPATTGSPLPKLAVARVRAADEVVSASPWLNGEKQVCPPAGSRLDLVAPYGDFDPLTAPRAPPAPALTQRIHRPSDPLNCCRPFPRTRANGMPAPVELHFTSKPCPPTGRLIDLLAITPRPFISYPAALESLKTEDVDKALSHIKALAHISPERVDQAAKAAGRKKPVGTERDLATKSALAYLVHRAMEMSRPSLLPEDLQAQKVPKMARRTWKRVKRVYPISTPTETASQASAATGASAGRPSVPNRQSENAASGSAPRVSDKGGAPSASKEPLHLTPSAPPSSVGPSPAKGDGAPTASAPERPGGPSDAGASSNPSARGAKASVDTGLAKSARPTLAAIGSTTSAPVVPGVRPRAKSIQGMRRVSTGPGVHPLAQLYATAPNTVRQQLREMSVAVPGVPSDPVAAALAAAAKKIQPSARRSISMTASPRLPSSNKELAHPSPPLIPIPLADASTEDSAATAAAAVDSGKSTDKGVERRLSMDALPPSGTSALGVTLDATPDESTGTQPQVTSATLQRSDEGAAASNGVDAMEIDFAAVEPGPAGEDADVSVEVADSQSDEDGNEQPVPPERPSSSASSSMFASAMSSVARAAGGALASAARAFLPGSAASTPSQSPARLTHNSAEGGVSPPKDGKASASFARPNQAGVANVATHSKTASAIAASKNVKPAGVLPKSTTFGAFGIAGLPPLFMTTEPLRPCALRDLAVKKQWMQASEPFRPFGP